MSEAQSSRPSRALDPLRSGWKTLPAPMRSWGPILIVGALLVLYPYYHGDLPEAFPSMDSGVKMAIFTMMALGLNVVVGYAGLLDLGYVAFYAAGAYVAGWFASGHFAQVTFHLGDEDRGQSFPGIHVNGWVLLLAGGIFAALLGVIIGLPTLRLRGDYLAIVTLGFGEIIPQVVRNGDEFAGTNFNLTEAKLLDRQARLRRPDSRMSAACQHRQGRGRDQLVLLGRAAGRGAHDHRLADAARLAPGPRLGRDPRGRDRRRRHGHPADAGQDDGLRDRRLHRRCGGLLLRLLQGRHVPGGLLPRHFRLHPLHGHPRRHDRIC